MTSNEWVDQVQEEMIATLDKAKIEPTPEMTEALQKAFPEITEREDGVTVVDVRGTEFDQPAPASDPWPKLAAAAIAELNARNARRVDPKLADLKRMGYRNSNGSKLFGQRQNAPDTRPTKSEVVARRKAERDRKRDQRRKARR